MSSSHSLPCNDQNNLYPEIKLLAKGTNSRVHLCQGALPGSVVAVKTIDRLGCTIPRESRALETVQGHENIVAYFGFVGDIDLDSQRLIFEYCQTGNLDDFRAPVNNNFPETFLWNAFNQISQGLFAIHKTGIVHGDLTTSNVLVGTVQPGELWPVLKISDFGAAVLRPCGRIPRSHCGTWSAQPPEAERAFGFETDIWSLGVIIHLLAHGKLPNRSVPFFEPDVEKWFHDTKKQIPVGVSDELLFKKFCYWRAQNFLTITPLYIKGASPARYSKLLNYFMLRALDIRSLRITSSELDQFLPTLKNFARDLTASGLDHMDILSRWEHDTFTDSRVIRHVYFALIDFAYTHPGTAILYTGRWLPSLMGAEDRCEAYRYLDAYGKRNTVIIIDDDE